LIVGWCGRFLFFVVPRQFSQGKKLARQETRKWLENQILIPDWTYFHCPSATLFREDKRVHNGHILLEKEATSHEQGRRQ